MKSRLAWTIVVVAALAYPLAVLAGGAPRFPSRAECVRPATTDQNIEAVFGRYSTQDAADSSLRRVLGLGFSGAQIEPDGCGLLKLAVDGVPSLVVGRDLAAEARRVGLHVALERAQP